MAEERSRVLTLVFTDLADSTALKSERGDQAVDALLTRHRAHVSSLAEECSGRIIDWAGDGCFLTFETSTAAVMFALRLQQAHADETDLPGVRIGIHLGEVTESQGPDGAPQVKGLAVDVAARVQGLAKPGQVLMSASVYNSARQRMGVEAMGMPLLWQLHGTYALKGFDTPLDIGEAGIKGVAPLEAPRVGDKARLVRKAKKQPEVYKETSSQGVPLWAFGAVVLGLVAVIGYLFVQINRQSGASPTGFTLAENEITSIAVLPFKNYSGEPSQEYFVDGMTDTLTAELAKIGSITVIARTSAMRYKNTELSISEIARELGVDGLIEGSVQQIGDEIRITAQLIDGRSEQHLWSENFDGTTTGVLRLQGEVAIAIAESINAVLTPQLREAYAEAPDVNPDAYDEYLRGLEARNVISAESQNRAVAHFRRAQELDPEFADAWGQEASTQLFISAFRFVPTLEALRAGKRAGARALELDPDNAGGLTIAIFAARVEEFEPERARRLTVRALQMHPNDVLLLVSEGFFQALDGNLERVKEISKRILELDPNSLRTQISAAALLALSFEYQTALEMCEYLHDQYPTNSVIAVALIRVYLYLDRTADALRIIETLDGANEHMTRGLLYAQTGRNDEAEEILRALLTSQSKDIAFYTLGLISLELGKIGEAFELFNRAADNAELGLVGILRITAFSPRRLADPEWQRMTMDQRYWALLDRMGYQDFLPHHPGYPVQQAYRARLAEADKAAEPIKRIAVLPFTSIASGDSQEWFADAMMDTLITELAKIKSITVISRTSSMQYKNIIKSMEEIAAELNVDALIEGSVLRVGDQVRINAQLIRGANDEHIWADRYDGSIEDVLTLQSEVALAIAEAIDATLTAEERALLTEARPVNPEAWAEYQLGKNAHFQWTSDGFERAEQHYLEAIRLDPDYAPPYAWKSYVHFVPSMFAWAPPDLEQARASADQALRLDPNDVDAIAAAGWMALYQDWDAIKGEELFRRVLDTDSTHEWAYQGLAESLLVQGRYDEAYQFAEQAVRADPTAGVRYWLLGGCHAYAGDFESAIQAFEQGLTLQTGVAFGALELPYLYALNGQTDEAIRVAREFTVTLPGPLSELLLASVRAVAGETAEAQSSIDRIAGDFSNRYVPPNEVAGAYAVLGDLDSAFEWMETALAGRYPSTHSARYDLQWKPMREDPRFEELLIKYNFPNEDGTTRR